MADRLNTPDTPVALAFRRIEPTWRNYVYYVERAAKTGDESMTKFVAAYNKLTFREKQTMMPEQICDLVGVAPADVIAAVARELWIHKSSETVITASMNQPRMMEATAFYGQMLADCGRDRELFFRVTGSLPDKKGTSVVINNNPQTANINNPPPTAGANGFRQMDQRVIEMGKLLDAAPEAVPIFQDSARVQQEISRSEN